MAWQSCSGCRGGGMCPLQSASRKRACLWRSRVCRSCCDHRVSCWVKSFFRRFLCDRTKDIGRSFRLVVRLANSRTHGPASSISPAQNRPRAPRRSTASDSTDTPVSQSRALARCRPVIKLQRERARRCCPLRRRCPALDPRLTLAIDPLLLDRTGGRSS